MSTKYSQIKDDLLSVRNSVRALSAKNGQLLGTSPSLDMMKKLIADYWYGNPDDYSFTEIAPDTWSVSSKTGVKPSVVVRKAKGRYRFERE